MLKVMHAPPQLSKTPSRQENDLSSLTPNLSPPSLLLPKATPSLLPPRIAINPLRLLPHPLHPPLHQLPILLLQLLTPLLRQIQLQPQRHHLILRLLDQFTLAAQLLVAVAQLALRVRFLLRESCDLRLRGALLCAQSGELRGELA